MTAPNHVTGGIVITGIFCSLWNINIFENPVNVSFVILGSLLPDVDHTKSIIGKLFYPIAKSISKNFGHRTITHSVFFLGFIIFLSMMLESVFKVNHNVSIILFFSVFSHLVLDMVTIQGIPLFYPFYKNPCVIPANVDLRLTTGNLKQEGIVLFIFSMLTLFLTPLFSDGFWFTYNKTFNDVSHLNREFKRHNKLVKVDYDFNIFQKNYKGIGSLIYSEENKAILINDSVIEINKKRQGVEIKKLTPIPTDENLVEKEVIFNNIKSDSLNTILNKKFITQGKIFSNEKVNFRTFKESKISLFKELKNDFNVIVTEIKKDSTNLDFIKGIQSIEHKIKIQEDALNDYNSKYSKALKRLDFLNNELLIEQSESHLYNINEIKIEIIELNNFVKKFNPKTSKTLPMLKRQLLEMKGVKTVKKEITFSGSVKYFELS